MFLVPSRKKKKVKTTGVLYHTRWPRSLELRMTNLSQHACKRQGIGTYRVYDLLSILGLSFSIKTVAYIQGIGSETDN